MTSDYAARQVEGEEADHDPVSVEPTTAGVV
jgi:hypothetical protein